MAPIMPTGAARRRSRRPLALALAVAAAAFAFPLAVATPEATLEAGAFTVPPGFEIALVAGPPLVNRPIEADFDEQGRLYVTDSSGSSDKVEKQLEEKPHRIVRLEDTDGDGVFDKSVVFADRMMFPEGAMWLDGSLYVSAPPSIWKLTDTDNDGIADTREEWFNGKTLTHCANDLHGPYLGPDGWIYWSKGAFAEQTYERQGKPPLVTKAAHIFRRRPAGGLAEPVMTGGMDNPVGVTFTSTGERLFTTTFIEHPQAGRRDALVHAIYGGVYGKPHDVIDGHPQTGDLMPVLSELGAAAPTGVTRYQSSVFGPGYKDNVFVAQFNMQKVSRHVLTPTGASFTSKDSDFVTSSNRDFHPTDVLEDADGSLLVIDTGGWYKLCCPTSQLAKPDVLGGIYRIRRRGAVVPNDPRGRGLDWTTMTADRLASLLGDARPEVRKRAIEQLAKLGPAAIHTLGAALRSSSVEARRNAVWALTRLDGADAREATRYALIDADPGVRQTALMSAALWRDAGALPQARAALATKSPAIQRVAAEALGRIGDAAAVPDLLAASAQKLDRALEHAMIYALIEIADGTSTRAGLTSSSVRTHRAALIALDQMTPAALEAPTVVSLLDSPDATLNKTAWWIAARHPNWGTQLRGYFDQRLEKLGGKDERDDLVAKLSQFSRSPAIESRLASLAADGPPEARVVAMRAMAASKARELPQPWIVPLTKALAAGGDVTRAAVATARALPAPKDAGPGLNEALVKVARDAGNPGDVRLDALAAVAGGLQSVDGDLFALLSSSLAPSAPATTRLAAAAVLEQAALDRAQLLSLASTLKASGPLELPRLLPAFDRGSDDEVGGAMVSALSESTARGSVRPDVLRLRLAKYSPAIQQRGEALLASLTADTAAQLKKLEELLAAVPNGDPRRGQLLFNSAKAACSTCHAIGYHGGTLGPDLTSIGQIRTERDLLEAIVFPNASFARGYEPVVITTKNGQTIGGLLHNDGPDDMVLLTGPEAQTRIDKLTIANMEPGTVSLMPAGFGELLSRPELADLLAFLKGTRWGAN
jgi:putative membrane-bound dehydrogenase-like protein